MIASLFGQATRPLLLPLRTLTLPLHRHRSPLTAHHSRFTLTLTRTLTLTLTLALTLTLPGRYYFLFGEPIPTGGVDAADREACAALYTKVQAEL